MVHPRDATIPEGVVRLEEVVSEFLEKAIAGELSPWNERLSNTERDMTLKRLARSLGPKYYRCGLSNFELYDKAKQMPVLSLLTNFATEMPNRLRQGSGLMLFGPAGTGKDHLMAALLKIAIARHRFSAVWWDGGSLYDAIAAAVCEEGYTSLRRRLLEPLILAISDPIPPRGYLSDQQLRRFRDVVDRRYRQTKSTWISTNLDTMQDAEALLTKPVLERITEGALQVFCDWESYRRRGERK